ncbi:MAG: hypothetical protein WC610_00985 [Patescibacteria group bacterium]
MNFSFKVFSCFILLFLVFSFFAIDFVYASYQKIAPGDTVTLGEFVFDDNFVATTTDCTIEITDPLNVMKVPPTIMTASTSGWHYYNYTTAGNAPSGVWPSVMTCGAVARGDLVIVDKSFIVDWSVVSTSTIKGVVDESLTVATSSLAAVIGANINAAVSSASSSLFATLPSAIWSFSGRTLTSFGTLVADMASAVWTSISRTLTGAGLDSGSLATQSYIDTATSTLAAKIQSGWTVTLSDFGETTVNTAYKAKLQVLNYATIPTDADSLPTVVITDSAGTVQVPNGVMTKNSNGTYSYSYSIGGSAVGGVWETVVSVVVNGETIKRTDYWNLSSSPADVQIIDITDKVIPTITASVRIDNKGTSHSDFYYVYCIVNSESNLCGGNDDVDSGSATAYINAGSFINLSLTLNNVPTAGTYWFKVKARALAETNWAAATKQFTAESGTVTPPVSPPGGGGGGGGGSAVETRVNVSGRAYPKSSVTLLKDAQVAATTIAGADANFQISVSNLTGGNYIFAVYGEDSKGLRSSLLTFPVSVTAGATTNVSGIFIAPTIAVDKSEVKRGDNIAIFGQSAPQADIVVSVNSEEEFFGKTISDKNGVYLYNFDSGLVALGTYYAKSKASIGNIAVSGFSGMIGFKVGTKNVAAAPVTKYLKGDLNNDQRVNLIDFSIAAYWYKRPLSATFKPIEIERLNGDGKVDLVDFSIMAFYWTG